MTIKKVFGFVHLWLGLITGLIVFIVCITAAIWSFSPEIENLIQPYRRIKEQKDPFLPVSTIKQIADSVMPSRTAERIDFEGRDHSAIINLSGKGNYKVYINPFNGKVLEINNENKQFFHWIKKGHYSLWLDDLGEEIVHWGTLIFFVILVSGIVLWWPRNKAARKQRFSIKKGSSFIRLNYDLHNVLGFYASWIILFAVLTALVWSFDILSDSEQWIGNKIQQVDSKESTLSSIPNGTTTNWKGLDTVVNKTISQYAVFRTALVIFPEEDSDVFNITVYPHQNAYDYDDYYFDQYTLKALPSNSDHFNKLGGGEKINRMNYDIHIGRIAGLTGRTAMFFASLICASLPITGFIIWLKRKKKKKKPTQIRQEG